MTTAVVDKDNDEDGDDDVGACENKQVKRTRPYRAQRNRLDFQIDLATEYPPTRPRQT